MVRLVIHALGLHGDMHDSRVAGTFHMQPSSFYKQRYAWLHIYAGELRPDPEVVEVRKLVS